MPVDAAISFGPLLPEIILGVAACAVLFIAQTGSESVRRSVPGVSLIAIVAAMVVIWARSWFGDNSEPIEAAGGLLLANLAGFVRTSALMLGILIALAAWAQPQANERGEFFSMMLLSLAGLMLVGPSVNLVVLFMALELVSIPTYVMVSLSRTNPRAVEAGTKYFYLGALAAAINAFGFSYLYGVIGGATLDADAVVRVTAALANPGSTAYGVAVVGVLFSLIGLLFKIAAVPLHFYIADVYQGAACPVAGLLGFVPKLAGLVAIFKVVALTGWMTSGGALYWVLWLVAALSMTVGNVLALRQTSIKRMLAYSGVAHSGYMLVGIIAGPLAGDGIIGNGAAAVLYYAVIYGIANLTAFAVLGLLRLRGRDCETIRDVAGLLRFQPGMALLLALAMFTLMGLPPTPGFWGKMSLFGSALSAAGHAGPNQTSFTVLVIIAVLNTAIAAAYYLRVIAALLLYESDEPADAVEREAPRFGVMLGGFLLLAFSFYPTLLMHVGLGATAELRDQAQLAHASQDPPPAVAIRASASDASRE